MSHRCAGPVWVCPGTCCVLHNAVVQWNDACGMHAGRAHSTLGCIYLRLLSRDDRALSLASITASLNKCTACSLSRCFLLKNGNALNTMAATTPCLFQHDGADDGGHQQTTSFWTSFKPHTATTTVLLAACAMLLSHQKHYKLVNSFNVMQCICGTNYS